MQTLRYVTPHMQGADVRRAQELLKKAGYLQGAVDGDFGPATAQASYWAQYWLGYADPQQAFGPALEKLLSGQSKPDAAAKARIAERKKAQQALGAKALAQMKTFIGLHEEGANNVPEITGWWGWGPLPWCAMTVSKAYVLAGSKAFSKGKRYAAVATIVHDARGSANYLSVTYDPKPGDLVCFDWDGSDFATDKNHVGMFESGTAAKFQSIEGNTGNARCERAGHTAGDAKHIVFVHLRG